MIMMVVNLAAYPLAVGALERKGRNAANRQLSQNAILLLSVSLPSAAGFAYLAPNIAEVFLGQAFRNSAAELMPLVTLGTLLAGIKAYYLDLSFQLGRYTMGQVWVVLVAAILNIVLNLWWIPQFGLMGAAYATVAAYAIGLGLSWQLGRRVFPLPWPRMDAAKIVLATLGMVLTLMPLGSLHGMWALAGQIAWGTLTFGLLFWLFDVGGIRALVSGLFAHIRGYRL
jgi:O-antigen/teichoic acid export membrane protein